MSELSISQLSSLAASGSADPTLLLQALQAMALDQLRTVAQASRDNLGPQFAELTALRQADLPDTLAALTRTNNGNTVELGANIQDSRALVSQIESLGYSLPTQDSFTWGISWTTYDQNGTLTGMAMEHNATAPELAAAQNAPKTWGPDANGMEGHEITTTSGGTTSTTNYTLYRENWKLTASATDVNTLSTQITDREQTLSNSIDAAQLQIATYDQAMDDIIGGADKFLSDARKGAHKHARNVMDDRHVGTQTDLRHKINVENSRHANRAADPDPVDPQRPPLNGGHAP